MNRRTFLRGLVGSLTLLPVGRLLADINLPSFGQRSTTISGDRRYAPARVADEVAFVFNDHVSTHIGIPKVIRTNVPVRNVAYHTDNANQVELMTAGWMDVARMADYIVDLTTGTTIKNRYGNKSCYDEVSQLPYTYMDFAEVIKRVGTR